MRVLELNLSTPLLLIGEYMKKESKPLSTHDRRMIAIKKLDGKYNGWWVYQYAMQDYALKRKKKG